MSYARKLLADGEEVVHASRQHVLAIARRTWAWLLVAAAGVGLALWAQGAELDESSRNATALAGLALLLIGAVAAGKEFLAWRHQEYLVTTRRVVKSDGILRKRLAETSLEKINDARIEQSWLGRMLGYGHLDLLTAAADSPLDDFPMLADPVAFQVAISNQRERLLQPGA